MTDRDHFAAAALTGLLAGRKSTALDDAIVAEAYAEAAYGIADAMLRERANHIPDAGKMVETPTNLDAAPEATANAESVAPQPTAGDRAGNPPSHSGTGDTPKPINDCVSDRSKPITGSDPDSRVWETPVHTPTPHATPGEGSVPREGTQEPVAWAVCTPSDGHWSPCYFHEPHAQRCANAIVGEKNVVPLYRHPPCQDASQKNLTLTDAEREDLQMWLAECLRQCSTATEGANEELAERWQGRAKRAAAMIERLGGVE